MPHIRSAGTAACLAEMLHSNHRHLGVEASTTGAEALAYICNTEDFVTYRVRARPQMTRTSLVEENALLGCEGGAGVGEGRSGRGGNVHQDVLRPSRADNVCVMVQLCRT